MVGIYSPVQGASWNPPSPKILKKEEEEEANVIFSHNTDSAQIFHLTLG